MSFGLTVYGRPQPAGSKRGFVNKRTGKVIITDDAKGSRPWKQEIAGAAEALVAEMGHTPWDEPLSLTVIFYLKRPASHYRSGKNSDLLKPSAPLYPMTKPDTTKLLRAVEDALNGIVWRDDSRVVLQIAKKEYGAVERCEITVTPMTGAA
jgi:Holliday junction resolvase RusA-like endonuclease